jgi:branched-chain amino acid transport system ATP-binding protein
MSDVILETQSLTKEFKGFTAVSNVTCRCAVAPSTP